MGFYQNRQLALAGYPSEGKALELPWGTDFPAWFQAVPPERVGVNGEYDYYGLQKRVEALLQQHFSGYILDQIRVGQRGRVVTLAGTVDHPETLKRLADLAMTVDGAIRVETVSVVCRMTVNS